MKSKTFMAFALWPVLLLIGSQAHAFEYGNCQPSSGQTVMLISSIQVVTTADQMVMQVRSACIPVQQSFTSIQNAVIRFKSTAPEESSECINSCHGDVSQREETRIPRGTKTQSNSNGWITLDNVQHQSGVWYMM